MVPLLKPRPLAEPFYRSVGLVMKSQAHLPPTTRKFIDCLPFREPSE